MLAQIKAENKQIQWEHSYLADDKTFCIYIAENDVLISEHAERSGFPATKVSKAARGRPKEVPVVHYV